MEILVNLLLIYLFLNILFKLSTQNKKISFYINTFILTIITGTLYEKIGGGGDYDNYRNGFNSINTSNVPDKELGFYYLNLFIKRFTDEYSIAFFIFILIINFLILKIIYKYSKNIEFSLLMYVIMGGYFTATNITRQFIALAIYVYSIKYLIEKRYICYLIIGFIAFQFHTTAIVPVLLSLVIRVFNEKISNNYIKYVLIVNMMIIIETIIRKIGIDLFYEGYESSTFLYGSNQLHYIVQLAFLILYIISIKKINNDETKFFINLATLASGFTLLSQRMVLYARLASYFNIFHVLASVNIVSEINDKKESRLIYYCIAVGLLVYYILLTRKSFVFESYILDYFTTSL